MVNSLLQRQQVRDTASTYLHDQFPGSLFIHKGTEQDEEEQAVYMSTFYQFPPGEAAFLRYVHLYWDDEASTFLVAYTDRDRKYRTREREAVTC